MVLVRVSSTIMGTFGVLLEDAIPFALTLERPWQDNATNISSIPDGIYMCRRVLSPKFGETFEIMDVPGRRDVLFHKGNRIEDTRGCVLVGEEFAMQEGVPILASSQRGYAEFMQRLVGKDVFTLMVRIV